jgi:hypothetical protein
MECRLNVASVGRLAITSLDAKKIQTEERKKNAFLQKSGKKMKASEVN